MKKRTNVYIVCLLGLLGQGVCFAAESLPSLAGESESEKLQEILRTLEQEYTQLSTEFDANKENENSKWLPSITKDNVKSAVKNFTEQTSQELKSCQYCNDVDQAAQLSSMIENFQEDVYKFCQLMPMRSFNKQLTSATSKVGHFWDLFLGGKNNAQCVPPAQKQQYNDLSNRYAKLEQCMMQCRPYGLYNNALKTLENNISKFYKPFLLKSDDKNIGFETIRTETDDLELPMVVYSPKNKEGETKLPSLVWLHGGSINSALEGDTTTLHVESPDQSPSQWDQNNISMGIQPLARFLVFNGIVFATIEMNPKYGKGDLCRQVIDQVNKIKKLSYVDSEQMTFCGHSIGGYVTSLLLVNNPTFLKQFKAVAFVSPVINEAWTENYSSKITNNGSLHYEVIRNHQQSLYFKFAQPDDLKSISLDIKGESTPIGECRVSDLLKNPEYQQRVLQCLYPFSPTCGLDDNNDALKEKLQECPPIFVLMGTADSNTIPATQGGAFIWKLKKWGLNNWRMFSYKKGPHSCHRFSGDPTQDSPEKEAFKTMLNDILKIAKNEYTIPNEIQNFDILSNGKTPINQQEQDELTTSQSITMRNAAELSFCICLENGEISYVPYKDTECGQAILRAMESNDAADI
ncbi:MAG: prolyl oligopeptidase family serine peptidase [Puniceicoccales bacterium]|nr:prolyl oligopeptidase family serine peptidase [Puniceicoccales bacterium]